MGVGRRAAKYKVRGTRDGIVKERSGKKVNYTLYHMTESGELPIWEHHTLKVRQLKECEEILRIGADCASNLGKLAYGKKFVKHNQ